MEKIKRRGGAASLASVTIQPFEVVEPAGMLRLSAARIFLMAAG
jgi:hypothetical protein